MRRRGACGAGPASRGSRRAGYEVSVEKPWPEVCAKGVRRGRVRDPGPCRVPERLERTLERAPRFLAEHRENHALERPGLVAAGNFDHDPSALP